MLEAVLEGVFTRARNSKAAGFRLVWAPFLLILFLCNLCYSRSRDTAGASFSIDLDKPSAEVLSAVSDVAHSGSIKRTFEYRDEEQLNGARFEEKSPLFPAWSGPGKVLYKVRAKTLSPSHFLNSNDVGTVAVRYVGQALSPNSTRLFIA